MDEKYEKKKIVREADDNWVYWVNKIELVEKVTTNLERIWK